MLFREYRFVDINNISYDSPSILYFNIYPAEYRIRRFNKSITVLDFKP
jgi:hypothetical protein